MVSVVVVLLLIVASVCRASVAVGFGAPGTLAGIDIALGETVAWRPRLELRLRLPLWWLWRALVCWLRVVDEGDLFELLLKVIYFRLQFLVGSFETDGGKDGVTAGVIFAKSAMRLFFFYSGGDGGFN